jgi:hypothetical protein
MVRIWSVGSKVVYDFDKLVNILLDRRCLFNVEELVKEVMLITAKTLVDQTTEGRPMEPVLDGLKPTFGGAGELHSGALDPNCRIDPIHLEIVLTMGDPELWVAPIKFREAHLR